VGFDSMTLNFGITISVYFR